MLQQEVVEEESQFTVYLDLPEGATLEATDEVVRQVEAAAGELPGVERFFASVQEGQGSVTLLLPARSERPGQISVAELKEQLEEQTREIPAGVLGYEPQSQVGRGGGRGSGGMRRQAGGFNLQAGAAAEQAVVRGHDFATLQMVADDLSYRFEELEEVDANSVRSDARRSAPEAQVIPDPVAMFDQGVEINTVLTAIADASPEGFQTRTAFLAADGTETPIEVRTTDDPEALGAGLQGLRQVAVFAPAGGHVPLEELARVRTDEGRGTIQRTDRARRVVVSYRFAAEILNSQPRLDAARGLVRDLVQDLVLPEGYTVELVESETNTVYYWMIGIAAILVYMILAALFESLASPIIIFGALPTAVIGSCWALILSETGLTSSAGPMALLGFVVLLGIAVNNGIILIDAVGNLRTRHGFRRERAVLAASRSRLRPILMTSATTLLGVLPLALEFGGDYEIWPPFALTVLGGLSVSMLSTLIFVPVAYMGLDQVREWMQRLGSAGVVLATLAAAAGSYALYARYQMFWSLVAGLPLWSACLLVVWIGRRVQQSREAGRTTGEPIRSLQLRTLTKAYGAPGRLRREWARFARRAERLLAAGTDPVDRAAVADSLAWKLPLLALAGYLHTYFEDLLWVYLLSLATWGLVAHLLQCLSLLGRPEACGEDSLGPRRQSDLRSRLLPWLATFLRRFALPATFVAYVQWRLQLPSVTVASAAVWLAFVAARALAGRVRDGRVDVSGMAGRLVWLRRRVYAGAAALPVIGVPRRPFRALDGVNLEIGRGMFGLLGPNGAGKTTLMRIVCQVLEPTSGSVALNGVNIRRRGHLQGLIGYLPQHFGLYDHLTAYQYLEYRALLEGLKARAERRERVLACLAQVNLLERRDDPIGSFSGGMRQRVGIAQTLLHLPRIVVVDEPTAGLDPVERIRFRNLLARVSQERIVIFSTHIVEDISGSCNRLAVLNRGRLLYSGTPSDMQDLARGRVWEAVVPEEGFARVTQDLSLITHVRTPAGIRARFLAREPVPDLEVRPAEPTLEDAYIHLLEEGRDGPC